MRFDRLLATAILLLASARPSLAADGDAVRGRRLYEVCAPCHQLAGESGETGPSLIGVFRRKAGSLEDFRFSRAMSRSGLTWDEQTLAAFLERPQSYVKGTRMPFAGMPDPVDRIALIAFLKTLTDRGTAAD